MNLLNDLHTGQTGLAIFQLDHAAAPTTIRASF